MSNFSVQRYHDISVGHRVHGHEGKCQHLHGHNYRIHFTCIAATPLEKCELDKVGRVIDFGEIKSKLCMWLEEQWDHKFLAWGHDTLMLKLRSLPSDEVEEMLHTSLVWVPFNPTAENMAEYLVKVIGPQQLAGTGILLQKVLIEETRKCFAAYSL